MDNFFEYLEEDKQATKEIMEEFGPGWLPPHPRISVETPHAYPGDRVVVNNYRRTKDPLCLGTVRHVKLIFNSKGPERYYYHIDIDDVNYSIWIRDSLNIVEVFRDGKKIQRGKPVIP